jgi:hypothetical protein
MKIKLHHILFLSVAMLTFVDTAQAQDAGLVDVEINDSEREKLDREKIISSPGEADIRYIPRSTAVSINKDSLVSTTTAAQPKYKAEKPAPTPKNPVQKQSKNEEEEDDSILGFNFLYYIIQKYKLQDIVD